MGAWRMNGKAILAKMFGFSHRRTFLLLSPFWYFLQCLVSSIYQKKAVDSYAVNYTPIGPLMQLKKSTFVHLV